MMRSKPADSEETSVRSILIEAVVVLLAVLVLLEGGSRLMHLGVRQMLPYIADDSLSPRMPATFSSKVQFGDAQVFKVCTDEYGMRGTVCGQREASPSVVTVGDSQAFGWSMSFEDSFTSKVAAGLGDSKPGAGRALAAGGADIESLLGWVKDYRKGLPQNQTVPKLNIVVVNLGNDLDEMYYGRATGKMPLMKGAREWLTVNSYMMLDINLWKTKMSPGSDWHLPPGANPIVLTLTQEERRQLAHGTAEAAVRLAKEVPAAEKTVILVLPTDYQVDPTEFDKYRKFYSEQAQFDSWRTRLKVMVNGLDEVEEQIVEDIKRSGFVAIAPRGILTQYDPTKIFDRSSHHYNIEGQTVLARAILSAIAVPNADRGAE